jgi:hypothetical protein
VPAARPAVRTIRRARPTLPRLDDVAGLTLTVLNGARDELAAVGRPTQASAAAFERVGIAARRSLASSKRPGANGAVSRLVRMPLIYAEGDPRSLMHAL